MWSSTLMILGSGVVLPSRGVVSSMQVGHGCSSVAANGRSGASDSSSARTDALVAGPDPEHHLGDAEAGVVLQLALVGDGPEGDDGEGGRIAPGLLGQAVRGAGWRRPGRCRRWGSSRRRTPPRRRTRRRWRRRRPACAPRGCCTGLGQDHVGPKSTNSPWYSAWSVDQMAAMAARCSRTTSWRRGQSTPWSSASARFQPNPTPSVTRPAGEMVERGHLLGQQDRLVLRDQQDAGAEPDARR